MKKIFPPFQSRNHYFIVISLLKILFICFLVLLFELGFSENFVLIVLAVLDFFIYLTWIALLRYFRIHWEEGKKSEFWFFLAPSLIVLLSIVPIILLTGNRFLEEWWLICQFFSSFFLTWYLRIYWCIFPYERGKTNKFPSKKLWKTIRTILRILLGLFGTVLLFSSIFILWNKIDRIPIDYRNIGLWKNINFKEYVNLEESCYHLWEKVYFESSNMMDCGGMTIDTYECRDNERKHIDSDPCASFHRDEYKCEVWQSLNYNSFCIAKGGDI